LFIDWLQTILLPWVETRRQRMHDDGSVELLLDGHAPHVAPRVIAYAGSEKIIIVQLVAYSSHLTRPLDVFVFRIFRIFYKKEGKIKGSKRETLKISRTIAEFSRSTIVQMVHWNFIRAEFRLNAQNHFGP
jgi:hypothetical protein